MITADELSKIGKEHRDSIFAQEMTKFEEVLVETAKKGLNKIVVPAPDIEGLFFYDDKQEAFASYLEDKGFKVQKEVGFLGGVKQNPTWYLYIY